MLIIIHQILRVVSEQNIFAGDEQNLYDHWQDKERAIRFRQGGTRTRAVRKVLSNLYLPGKSWLDTATGAGFVQTQVSDPPLFFVGLDFSLSMLEAQQNPLGSRVLGSLFALPFRRYSFDLISNIFCLSDYPNIKEALEKLSFPLRNDGQLVHVDYAKGDDYWEQRKQQHGQIINGKKIVGNINLRTLQEMGSLEFDGLTLEKQELIETEVDASTIESNIIIEGKLVRKFLFSIWKKI